MTKVILSCLCLASLMTRCASIHSPQGWLPTLSEVQSQAFGGWTSIEYQSAGETKSSSGELLAMQEGRLFILNESGVSEIFVSEVQRIQLEIFKEERIAGLWAILGVLSTASHGGWLLLTAPIWIISGIGFSSGESKTGLMEFQGPPSEEIKKFARFPQGLPKNIDLQSLKVKSLIKSLIEKYKKQ